MEKKMKINLESNDFYLTDFDYEDFERIKCVNQGIKGIHDELRPSISAYERQRRLLEDSDQIIYELTQINDKLHNDLYNENFGKIHFYHKIILRDFILYLKTTDTFVLYMTLEDIKESLNNFEEILKNYQFEEISDYYLTYIKILSFFQNVLEKDKKFLEIKDYCFSIFREKHNTYLRIGKENFDTLFIESVKYGERIYEYLKAKNGSEVTRLVKNL